MQNGKVITHITDWLSAYSKNARTNGFVVGVSGGIDSAVTSTLCARTGLPLHVLEMPIHQHQSQVERGQEHIDWLKSNYDNVTSSIVDLTSTYEEFIKQVPAEDQFEMARVNTRARLRMSTLYYFAGMHNRLVAGTGNKVEDFGVGFYTKYGDGGVDLSPIADLYKSEVYAIAGEMGILESIMQAAPTDGLWGDDRTDEDQIGASYPELEWAMEVRAGNIDATSANDRQQEVLRLYDRLNRANQHKMVPIPVCEIPEELKD